MCIHILQTEIILFAGRIERRLSMHAPMSGLPLRKTMPHSSTDYFT